MLLNSVVQVNWRHNNREWYESMGYKFTFYDNSFDVKVNHLIENSAARIYLKCDDCGFIESMPYQQHRKSRAFKIYGVGTYFCPECLPHKKLRNGGFASKKTVKWYEEIYKEDLVSNGVSLPDHDEMIICVKNQENLAYIPSRMGIYKFFSHDGELLYVGSASNLHKRISDHICGKSNTSDVSDYFYFVSYFYVEDERILEDIEILAINELKPKYNLRTVYTYNSSRYTIQKDNESRLS